MSELEDFLAEIIPRHHDAAEALHQEDPEPLSEPLARRDPIASFRAWPITEPGETTSWWSSKTVAPKFSDCSPLSLELIAADINGDLAYTVGYEHSAVPIDGGPVVRNECWGQFPAPAIPYPSSTVAAANYLRPHAAGRMEHKEVAMTRRVRRWVAAAVAVAATGLVVGRAVAATTGVNQCWSRGFPKPIRTPDVSGPGSVRVTS